MTANDDNARRQLADPSTTAQQLADIAYDYPHLAAEITRHPNVYQGLVDWLAEYGVPEAAPVEVAAPVEIASPVMPAQTHGFTPSSSVGMPVADSIAPRVDSAPQHYASFDSIMNQQQSQQPAPTESSIPLMPRGGEYTPSQLAYEAPEVSAPIYQAPASQSPSYDAPLQSAPVQPMYAPPATQSFETLLGSTPAQQGAFPASAAPQTQAFPAEQSQEAQGFPAQQAQQYDAPPSASPVQQLMDREDNAPSFAALANAPQTAPFSPIIVSNERHRGEPPVDPDAPLNIMAVLSIIFCLGWLGILFGVIAKRQIRTNQERGWALAHWGIILGTVFTVLGVVGTVLYIMLVGRMLS